MSIDSVLRGCKILENAGVLEKVIRPINGKKNDTNIYQILLVDVKEVGSTQLPSGLHTATQLGSPQQRELNPVLTQSIEEPEEDFEEKFKDYLKSFGYKLEEITIGDETRDWWKKGQSILSQGKYESMRKVFESRKVGFATKNEATVKNPSNTILTQIQGFWNSYANFEAIKNKFKIDRYKLPNKTTLDKLLPHCEVLSHETKQNIKQHLKTRPDIKDYEFAIEAYAKEILMRDSEKKGDYKFHRFTIYEFFQNDKGFVRFINKK
jgi:hypothetical protein